MNSCSVSIVVSAYHSATIISETLASILAQTFSTWEAIVVYDSADIEISDIVHDFAAKEPRIRLVNQPYQGRSVACNTGFEQAYFDWVLFIDGGDWILPNHLERLTDLLVTHPDWDVAYCGWVRVTADQQPYGPPQCLTVSGDLFDLLAASNPFVIHGCVVRRSLVEAVGKFDPTLETQEDWDLWQRIARTGAFFGGTKEVLAFDRIEPRTGQNQPPSVLSLFREAMGVLAQGHRADPRVEFPHANHAGGQPSERLPALELELIGTYVGLAIGAGEDFRPILAHLCEEYSPDDLSMDLLPAFLYALPLPTCHPLSAYHDLWESLEQPIDELALALEQGFRIPALAPRLRLSMERAILEQVVLSRPVRLRTTYAVQIELTQPIPDIAAPLSTERLHCTLELAGKRLGVLELPVFDGKVGREDLAEAIATDFSDLIFKQVSEPQVAMSARSLNPKTTSLSSPNASNPDTLETFQLPILMYHHVAPTGSAKFSRWRVTPTAFEAQLRCLQEAGAYSITLAEWHTAMIAKTPLPGKPVLITFDDGYLDFATYAWPLLKRYGFSATVFVVAGFAGKTNRWDSIFNYGEELAILDWPQIRDLHSEGVEFGSHTLNHYPLTSLSPSQIIHEAVQSRILMEHELGIPVRTFAYPYGDLDPLVQRLIGTCGYDIAVSCRSGYSTFHDPLLQLARIEISGTDQLQEFQQKLLSLFHDRAADSVAVGT